MYRNKLSPVFLEQGNDVILDFWWGSSEVTGTQAVIANLLNPASVTAPSALTVSSIWDRWMDPTARIFGNATPDGFSWDLTLKASGQSAGTTTFAYGQGLWYQQNKPVKSKSINLDTTPYHYTSLLGISTGAVNDDLVASATKLTHWSPLVTGVGFLTPASTDMSALQLYTGGYITPAIKNLQAAGKRVFIGGMYVSVSGDSLTAYSPAVAYEWCTHFAMIRRYIESVLGFVGVPTIILGVGDVSHVLADKADLVRESQQKYVDQNSDTTMYFDTLEFPTGDKIHFDGQATLDIAAEATAMRYGNINLGLAEITKKF